METRKSESMEGLDEIIVRSEPNVIHGVGTVPGDQVLLDEEDVDGMMADPSPELMRQESRRRRVRGDGASRMEFKRDDDEHDAKADTPSQALQQRNESMKEQRRQRIRGDAAHHLELIGDDQQRNESMQEQRKQRIRVGADHRPEIPPPAAIHNPSFSCRCYFDGRRIYRVPAQLMRKNKDNYAPTMVSFGPYNHPLKKKLPVAEEIKLKVVDMFVSQTGKSRDEFFNNVLQVIGQIRLCYDGINFTDAELAEIMLQDTFFLIYLMQKSMKELNHNNKFLIENSLGIAAIPCLYTDMLLLSNQIPLSIVNLFISLIHNKEEEKEEDGSSFVLRYILKVLLLIDDDDKIKSFPPAKDRKQPLHVLDACWRLLAQEYTQGQGQGQGQREGQGQGQGEGKVQPPSVIYRDISRPFRPVSDLKGKGVHFKPTDSHYVRDIKFKSWIFFGTLQLPILSIDVSSKVVYSNLIAYEMSPGSTSQLVITSYINFMKSLIVTPKDVHELREKGILFSTYDSDDQMLKQFKEIDTYGLDNPDIFCAEKEGIEAHCRRKEGTWIAELIYTYFGRRTLIGALVTFCLLELTIIQTYYTVHPAS